MNTKVCPKCGKDNAAQMKFCSNCGQNLPDNTAPNYSDEPPPTVLMGQPPPIPPPSQQSPFGQSQPSASSSPFGQPNPPNNPFGQQNAPNNPQFSTPAPPAQPPKKSNKGLIFGAIGCLGLLVLSVIGIGIVGFFYYGSSSTASYNTPTPTPYASNSFASNSGSSNSAKNTNTTSDNKNTSDNTNATTDANSASSTLLTTILESRKTVGSFNQTAVKSVVTADYFPEGTGAAQASYSNGSKYVYLTVGQFASMDDSKKNFNDQIRGIKGNGGKVTYQNTASDGTISAIYEKGGYYFAEYCNTNSFCNRIHSDNREALKSFFGSYAKD